MKKVSFNVVCILAMVFPGIPKLKTPSFALGYHYCINKKLRQLMLPSIVLIAGLFICVDLSSQWERIPDFNIGCNDMVLTHEDTMRELFRNPPGFTSGRLPSSDDPDGGIFNLFSDFIEVNLL